MSTCKDCVSFDENCHPSYLSTKGYCEQYKTYYYPGADACRWFIPREDGRRSLCYVTTIVCNMLGYSDNCEVLETLRDYRDNFLQERKEYLYLLHDYDIIGPSIARCIEENNDLDIAKEVYNKKLIPICNMIKNKQYLNAAINYENMTYSLINYYGLKDVDSFVSDYDYTKGGHGKLYIKKNKTRTV